MFSILIPVFNFNIRPLVADLHRQCEANGSEFEILCFDDGSTEDFRHLNREVASHKNVIYKELPQNLGRSAIRNVLGKAARFPLLLFMDCDSKVVREGYVGEYLSESWKLSERLATATFIVYGGRCYSKIPPADPSLFFHWRYGIEREQSTAEQRCRSPYHSFMTNNFLIPRALFLSILFDENLRQYGHEDTLFGLELARRQVPILHIDNPLKHIGLEPAEVFLEKTRQGVENLAALWRRGAVIETRLLRMFLQVKKWRMGGLLAQVFKWSEPLIVSNLKSKNPGLRLFDFYKLGYFSSLDSRPVSTSSADRS